MVDLDGTPDLVDDEFVLDLALMPMLPLVVEDGTVGRLLVGVEGRDDELGLDIGAEDAVGARDERLFGPPAGELL